MSPGNGSHASARVLVIRPDRLGDVLLSTPVIAAIRQELPGAHITFWARPEFIPLLRGLPGLDVAEPLPPHAGFVELLRRIWTGRYDAALVLRSGFRLAAALWLARVRARVGPLSHWYSYFLYNAGLKQSRSLAERHERDYGLELAARLLLALGRPKPQGDFRPRVAPPSTEARARASAQIQGARPLGPGARWVAIHPGMGGSALNWPEDRYVALAQHLARDRGWNVVITAGPTEQAILDRFRAALARNEGPPGARAIFFVGGADAGPLDELAALDSLMDVVVAPSTGPLHLAASVGTAVVGFYPPIRVQSARRWGPILAQAARSDGARARTLTPNARCGQVFTCRGAACEFHPCMELITLQECVAECLAAGAARPDGTLDDLPRLRQDGNGLK